MNKYNFITKKILEKEYIKNKKSVIKIAKEINVPLQTLYSKFRQLNIKRRTKKEARKITKHNKNCQCGMCKVMRGETKGKNNPFFGKMKSGKDSIRFIDGRTLKKYYCKVCNEEITRSSGFYGNGLCNHVPIELHLPKDGKIKNLEKKLLNLL